MTEPTFTPEWLAENGFEGFATVEDIRLRRASVSASPGVYVVFRDHLGTCGFLDQSTGGWFKGRNPTVPVGKLREKWIEGAHVLYIGKADAGNKGTRGISARLGEYLRFGQGEPIGHWGGRYIWQLAGVGDFLVCWKASSNPPAEEAQLLELFRVRFESLPFANLRAGSRPSHQGM